jgi:hypothetical protein
VPTDYASVENSCFTGLLGHPVCQILEKQTRRSEPMPHSEHAAIRHPLIYSDGIVKSFSEDRVGTEARRNCDDAEQSIGVFFEVILPVFQGCRYWLKFTNVLFTKTIKTGI